MDDGAIVVNFADEARQVDGITIPARGILIKDEHMDGRALLFRGVNEVGVGQAVFPQPEGDQALVEVLYSAVSPGTELRCLRGQQPNAPAYPYIPGYSSVGRVIAVGADAGIAPGTLVFSGGTEKADYAILWGGHSSHVVKASSKLMPIPDGVDPRQAVLAKLAAIAYHGVRLGRAQPHEEVLVVGLGAIGQLSARLHTLTGARVVALDRAGDRVAVAHHAGIEAYTTDDGVLPAARRALPHGADVLVDATGVPAVLAHVLHLGRDIPWDDSLMPGSRLLIQGSYPGDVPLDYDTAFRKELTIVTPRDNQPRDIAAVLNFMARGQLNVDDLASQIAAPDDAPAIYDALASGEMLTALFDWSA